MESEFKAPVSVDSLKKLKDPAEPASAIDKQASQSTATSDEKEFGALPDQKRPEKAPLGPRGISPSDREKYEKILRDLKYCEPLGSAPADERYSLEVLKTGTILDRVTFKSKRYFLVGRIPGCDIVAEHPTVSRLHAILQFIDGSISKVEESASKTPDEEQETQVRDKGLYIYDLGSTHGTFLNKNRLFPNRFYRLRVGHVVKFGNSTRMYIVCGPDDDEEEESEKTVTELLKERLDKELERKKFMNEMEKNSDAAGANLEDQGVTWGMAEDAEEESDLRENPFSMDFESTDLSLDNPKKTLRGWFEREGYDLEYDVREKAAGHFICRIDLPLDGPDGGKVFAEVEHKGKKKEVVHQCALQACQILDKYGVLRQSHHESRVKRKHRDWEEQDYYSSDEDTFLDRTGTVEKKREKRMMEAGKIQPKVETFESLLERSKSLAKEIAGTKEQLAKAEQASELDDDVDPLDAYMSDLRTGTSDVKKIKAKLRELVAEQMKNQKLLDIAKPVIVPVSITSSVSTEQKSYVPVTSESTDNHTDQSESIAEPDPEIKLKKAVTPMVGPRVQFKITPMKMLAEVVKVQKEKPLPDDEPEDITVDEVEISPQVPLKETLTEEPSSKQEANEEDEVAEKDDESVAKAKVSKRVRRRKQANPKEIKHYYETEDPKYSTWLPPTNQKGDGRTALNDKLGY